MYPRAGLPHGVTGEGLPIEVLPSPMALKDMPVGTVIHNIELKPGKGAQLVRSAGVSEFFFKETKRDFSGWLQVISSETKTVICLKAGEVVLSGPTADIKPGNAMALKDMPVGTVIHNIELKPGKGVLVDYKLFHQKLKLSFVLRQEKLV